MGHLYSYQQQTRMVEMIASERESQLGEWVGGKMGSQTQGDKPALLVESGWRP